MLIPHTLRTSLAVFTSADQIKAKHRYYKATQTRRPPACRDLQKPPRWVMQHLRGYWFTFVAFQPINTANDCI